MPQDINIEKILSNENHNTHRLYLYLEERFWCAYEHSAYYLFKMKAPVVLKKEKVIENGCEFILMKAQYTSELMPLPISKETILEKISDTNLEFRTSEGLEAGYTEWRKAQLESLVS